MGEEGLRLLIKVKGQEGIRRLRGKVAWEAMTRSLEWLEATPLFEELLGLAVVHPSRP